MMSGTEMMMDTWSVWHWLMFAIVAALILYPTGRILSRLGFSPFWAVVAFVPLANLIGLWVIALTTWPRCKGSTS